MDAAGAAIYGMLETKAKADATNFLNKIPRPIAQLGYAGGTAIALHLLNTFFVKNRYLGHVVNGITAVAAYQMGRAGGLPTTADAIFSVAGDGDDMLSGMDMGALAEEAGYDGDDVGGLDADNPGHVGGLDADNPGGMGYDEGLQELGDDE